MNLMGNFENLMNQGPVFWVAAAAVAGGLTLLLVSLTLQTRKIFSGRPNFLKIIPWKNNPLVNKKDSNYPAIDITDTGYGLAGKTAISANISPKTYLATDSKALEGLLLRLRQAGDQLEEIQDARKTPQATAHNSLLKQPNDNVEYLIRTGIS